LFQIHICSLAIAQLCITAHVRTQVSIRHNCYSMATRHSVEL